MATKMYNSHLDTIISKCKQYYILDVYIALVHISTEVNSLFVIKMYNESKIELINTIKQFIHVKKDTIKNCVNKLIDINILTYDKKQDGWVLIGMENMIKEKAYDGNDNEYSKKFTGYTKIRKLFFTKKFAAMKAREKRLVLYLTQLADSKASKLYKNFSMNLLAPNNNWLNIIKTKSKYYAKYTVENMLKAYRFLFIDNSNYEREQDLSEEKTKAFKFLFQCEEIKKEPKNKEVVELVKETHPKEYELILKKLKNNNITLGKEKIMHLIRVIATIKEWFLKEIVLQRIINKFIAIQVHRSRGPIYSIFSYTTAIAKDVITEYNELKKTKESNALRKHQIEEPLLTFMT